MSDLHNEELKVKEERVRILYTNGITLIVANIIAGLLFFYINKGWTSPLGLFWGGLLASVLLGQTILTLFVRNVSLGKL